MAGHPMSTGAVLLLDLEILSYWRHSGSTSVASCVMLDINSLDCIYHCVEFSNIGQSLLLLPDISLLKPKIKDWVERYFFTTGKVRIFFVCVRCDIAYRLEI